MTYTHNKKNRKYPKKQLKTDLAFYNMTKKLGWVKPEHLDIKKEKESKK